jgi:hypothetical protein
MRVGQDLFFYGYYLKLKNRRRSFQGVIFNGCPIRMQFERLTKVKIDLRLWSVDIHTRRVVMVDDNVDISDILIRLFFAYV